MKIFVLAFFLLFTLHVSGQQFSQYNTGTVYESFENPAIQSFTPDSSRNIAFNFFIPNFTSNIYVNGNAQAPLKSRAFNGRYNTSYLRIGEGQFNRANATANVYLIMLRLFRNLNGNTDMGFSVQTRMESRGLFSDESVALFNGASAFPDNHYDNIFNNEYTFQAYHQVSFSYRENITKKFAIGVKLSALLGIEYQKLNITNSSIDFDRQNDQALLGLGGYYRNSYSPGGLNSRDLLPTFRNPGASVTIGTSVRTRDNFLVQANIKDLGFIHWSKRSGTGNFNSNGFIRNLSTRDRENNIFGTSKKIIQSASFPGGFVTPTNGKIELSINKTYWLSRDFNLSYSPTIIGSKEFFFPGGTLAMVNPVQYKNYTFSLTTSYDTYRIFHLGGQFMIKAPNAEFFIGSERFIQSGKLLLASTGNDGQINRNSAYSGADLFMGFSVKFGSVIEHPMNASFIPMEEHKGFFARIWSRLFHHGE
jgi:hypothetical protein